MSRTVEALARRFYPHYRSESDALHETIERHLRSDSVVLDLGCGSGARFPRDYRASGRRVVGVDVDAQLRENRRVDDRVHAAGEHLPFRDASFDVVYSRFVFEHLEHPAAVVAEFARVLRPGGVAIILTPNVWHYVPVLARLTPEAFHRTFNARLRARPERDTFPTRYRANSRRRLACLAADAGLREVETRMIETRPNYLMWSPLPFLLGVAYERTVNSTPALRDLRVNILGVYARPERA